MHYTKKRKANTAGLSTETAETAYTRTAETANTGTAETANTGATNPAPKSIDARLLDILDTIQSNDLTLSSFLCKLMLSEDKEVMRRIRYFYNHKGPATVIKAWYDSMDNIFDVEDTAEAALEFVVKVTTQELSRVAEGCVLNLSSKRVTADVVNKFSLERISRTIRVNAPILTKLLERLLTINDTPTRSPKTMFPTIASMLMIMRSSKSNYLQKILSLYLYSSGASRKVIEVLEKIGLSISYSSLMTALRSLTEDALKRVRLLAATEPFLVVYDNINIASKKADQRLHNKDDFQNGATATVIASKGFAEASVDPNPCRHLSLDDLVPTADNNIHRRKAFRHHLLDVLSRHSEDYQHCKSPEPTVRVLETKKTKTYPVPSMHIDQSSVEGNKDILETIMEGTLKLSREWFDRGIMIILAGDQLTMARIRTLIELRWDDVSAYHRLEWAIPVMQLFHLQMLLGATILRHHYGHVASPGSLAYNITMLGRKRVNCDKPDFHAADELLRHTFDAMVLVAWQEVLGTDDLKRFSNKCSKKGLSNLTNAGVDTLMERFLDPKNLHQLNCQASQNAALFIRDMLFYIELSAAIKAGDVGRIEEVIKWLTVIFQADTTKKYANELLHLHCGLNYSWSAKTKEAVLSSWLVNTTGQPNRWIPTDLYQEHNNCLTKVIHAAKGSNATWDVSAQSISANIRTFQHIKSKIEDEYQIPYNDTRHQKVSATLDIERIARSIKENKILSREPFACQSLPTAEPVSNLLVQGMIKLTEGGRIQGFMDLQKNCSSILSQEPELTGLRMNFNST
ncbi:hypothetical protein BGZ65_003287 [Modicella reniformis]|uniref:DUF6589 domain-containing protein n=1 Tax=Modicella reniformis TaxID=1440133 RepID=A0A9P6J2Y4_9FUNG|nr:hypothetical protein BGZ65_003287 [Modicella reniformis]